MTNTHCHTKCILLCCKAFLRNITYTNSVFQQYVLFFTYTILFPWFVNRFERYIYQIAHVCVFLVLISRLGVTSFLKKELNRGDDMISTNRVSQCQGLLTPVCADQIMIANKTDINPIMHDEIVTLRRRGWSNDIIKSVRNISINPVINTVTYGNLRTS